MVYNWCRITNADTASPPPGSVIAVDLRGIRSAHVTTPANAASTFGADARSRKLLKSQDCDVQTDGFAWCRRTQDPSRGRGAWGRIGGGRSLSKGPEVGRSSHALDSHPLGGCCVTQCFPEFTVQCRRISAISLSPLEESLICQTRRNLLRDRVLGPKGRVRLTPSIFNRGTGTVVRETLARLVVALICLPLISSVAFGNGCDKVGDWRNIYVLAPNANPSTNIKISVTADKTEVAPGDTISITFQADDECYLTLMGVGTSGKILRLWPNEFSGNDNRIAAHQPRVFPGSTDNFRYRTTEPAGVERIVAYATSEKGKILNEAEFQQLGSTGFKQFRGSVKDLAVQFQKNTQNAPGTLRWGSAQANVCITQRPPVAVQVPLPPRPSGQAEPVVPRPNAETKSGNLYCLAIGVSLGKLTYCESDAQKVVDALKAKGGLTDERTRMVLRSQATYAGFAGGMEWLAAQTEPEDSVIIYFNGHGGRIPDRWPYRHPDGQHATYVLYHSDYGRVTAREALRRKYLLPAGEFNVLLKRIPARKKVLIADACHSGGLLKDVFSGGDDLVSKFCPFLDADSSDVMIHRERHNVSESRWGGSGRGDEVFKAQTKEPPAMHYTDHEAVLAACLKNQSCYESKSLRGSVFTYHLVRAMTTGNIQDLRAAFAAAEKGTLEYCVQASRRVAGRGQPLTQNPSLFDPHGFVGRFRISP
jgi:hypothetical protein